jgi:hypothetical protein
VRTLIYFTTVNYIEILCSYLILRELCVENFLYQTFLKYQCSYCDLSEHDVEVSKTLMLK